MFISKVQDTQIKQKTWIFNLFVNNYLVFQKTAPRNLYRYTVYSYLVANVRY